MCNHTFLVLHVLVKKTQEIVLCVIKQYFYYYTEKNYIKQVIKNFHVILVTTNNSRLNTEHK